MAGLSNRPSLRDSLGVEDTIVPELDAWAKSPKRGGDVDGTKHASYIQNVSRAIMLGQISEEGAMNLANRIHGLAPFILPAIGERKQALSGIQKNKEMIGQYINEGTPAQPGTPAVPFIPDDAGAFPESDAQLQTALRSKTPGQFGLLEQEATADTPAVPAKADYAGLQNAAVARGQFDIAKQARELGGLDKTTEPKVIKFRRGKEEISIYQDPRDGQWHEASGDPNTRTAGAGEITSVKLGAAFADPSSYDPLELVEKHGVQKAKNIYKGMYDNAKSLERIKWTDASGVGRENIMPRSGMPSGGKSVDDFSQIHKDVQKVGESFEKTRMLENAIDELDILFEKNPTSVKSATGNVKNISLSDYMKSEDARNATAIISTIEAEVIRKNAGLTQTESELARTKAMLARTAAYSASDFEKAFRRLQKTYAQEKKLAFNKLGKEGKEIAADRFGMNPDKLPWEERADAKKTVAPTRQKLRYNVNTGKFE